MKSNTTSNANSTPADFIISKPTTRPKKQIDSEKVIEEKLRIRINKIEGARCIKLMKCSESMPDRLVLRQGGESFYIEVKTTGKKPTPIQLRSHARLRSLGFTVYVLDTIAGIDPIIEKEFPDAK
jgi:hypothetical protein